MHGFNFYLFKLVFDHDQMMFARLDDEIMRCKNRLVFLARVTVPSSIRGAPGLVWDKEALQAIFNGRHYNYIRFSSTDNPLNKSQKIAIRCGSPRGFQILNDSDEYGNQILFSVDQNSAYGGVREVSYVLSTEGRAKLPAGIN